MTSHPARPGEADFRAVYRELVETDTSLSSGSCTLAAERMAAALNMKQDSPESVAEQLVDAFSRRSRERYLGWPEKAFVRLNSLFPRLLDVALARQSVQMRRYALEQIP